MTYSGSVPAGKPAARMSRAGQPGRSLRQRSRRRMTDAVVLLSIMLVALLLIGAVTWRHSAITAENQQITDRRASELALALSAALRDALAATMVQADTLHNLARQVTLARLHHDMPTELALRPALDSISWIGTDEWSQVGAIDHTGTLLWAGGNWSPDHIDLSDRPYFVAFAQTPALNAFVDRPVVGRLSGVLSVPTLRSVREADGSLAAITIVHIRATLLQRLCQDFALAPEDSVSLLRDDGVVLMRRDMTHLGEVVPGWVRGQDQPRPDHRVPVTISPLTGTPSYIVARPIVGTQMVVRVALSAAAQAEALGWVHTAAWSWAIVADIAIVAFAFAGAFAVVMRRRTMLAAERAAYLEDSEAWFRNVLDDIPMGVCVMDDIGERNARLSYVNTRLAAMLGGDPPALIGKDWADFVHPEDRRIFEQRLGVAANGAALPTAEYRLSAVGGRTVWVRAGSVVMPRQDDRTRLRLIALIQDVTEERERAAALQDARTGLDRIQKLVPGAFYERVAPPGGDFALTFASESAAALLGRPYEEISRDGYLTSHAVGDLAAMRRNALAAADPSSTATIEFRLDIDGRQFWLRESMRQFIGDDGSRHVVGYIADATAEHSATTARQQAEAALQRRNWALAAFSRSLAALIHLEDFNGLLIRICESIVAESVYVAAGVWVAEEGPDRRLRCLASAGPASEYFDGLELSWDATRPEGQGPAGRAIRDRQPSVMHDSLGDPVFAPWRDRAAAFGIRSSVTVPNAAPPDLPVRTMLNVYAREPDAFGAEELGLFQRLTDEIAFAMELDQERARAKANEVAKQAAEANLQAVVQLGPGVLYRARVDDAGIRVLSVFGDAARVTAGLSGVAEPADLTAVLSPAAGLPALLFRPGEDAHSHDFAVTGQDSATRWLRNVARVVSRVGRTAEIVGYLSEVTQEKQEQLHRQQMTTLLTLGEMATGMAHELNQPLSSISFAAQNAELRLNHEPVDLTSLRAKIEKIAIEARRAARLVEHMRVFARNEREAPRPVSWHAVAQSAMEILAPKLRGCTLTLEIADDLPMVMGAPIPLEQVLINLIANAVDAYDGLPADVPRAIRVIGHADGDWVTVCVGDHAGGIVPAALPRLFEPFFTTKPVGKGTGLGLALSFGTVTEYGGTIAARNEDGGAVFEVRLPRV